MTSPIAGVHRPRQGRLIAGVCAGLAQRFHRSPWLIRTVFVVSCVLPGPQVLVYAALWLVLPEERTG